VSEQITHLAVADDARLVALASPRICDPIRQVLRDHHDRMRLGAVTRGSEKFAWPIVKALRDRRGAPQADDAEKLAFCLGTMAHRAADRMMKPIFKSQSADGACEPKDISVYHDVFLFDRIYGRGAREPYGEDALSPEVRFPSAPGLDSAAVEAYFRVLWQRALLSAHTFKPDYLDPEGWMEALFDRVQEFTVDVGRYHKALTEPDERIIRRAIMEVNFYDESNSVIALLGELRAGHAVGPKEFLERCAVGEWDSLYARAVSAAYGYLHVTSEYWLEKASEELFSDAVTR
jgi:hypothetical protein